MNSKLTGIRGGGGAEQTYKRQMREACRGVRGYPPPGNFES